jgi:tetratricopeptide (TPR) repeat protein
MPTDGLVDAGASHRSAEKARHATVTMEDVREHLMSLRASALVDLILQQADEDDRLRDTLKMRVAARLAGGPDTGTFRTALREAFRVDFDEPWQGTQGWAHGAGRVIDSIGELLGQGHAWPVIELCEEALELLDSAWGMIDDSDGDLAVLAERIGDLHLEACQAAGIDQAELGRRLVDLEFEAKQHEAFYGAIDRYELVLGEAGLAAYRQTIERRWASVLPLGPGESDPDRYGNRFRLTQMMERVTELSGDVDELVAVMARDLSAGHDFLRIAQVLREAGRHGEALAWAERGLAAAGRPEPRLREFAADEHHRVGRHEAAVELIWAAFGERPGLDTYQRLREHARVGGADWSAWSDRALAFLRADIERRSAGDRRQLAWEMPVDRSSLVEIFLWQDDVDAAWREAREGGCTRDLWLRLAQLRERDHPEDAVPIYKERVQALLDQKNNRSYEEAVATMRRLRGAMSRMEPPANFAAYVTALRAEHARKRNFMAILDRARW